MAEKKIELVELQKKELEEHMLFMRAKRILELESLKLIIEIKKQKSLVNMDKIE